MEKNYFVGLDMGTSSVGWAVTDPEYHLLRAKGKDLWGARLFDEAHTAVDRRTKRVARRRRQREVARVGLLKEYFADEISKVDENFFIRLEESKYLLEDRSNNNCQPNGIFNDSDYTDKDYFEEYPTIFHLRKELIENKEPHDVRLIYLALLNMFKHRGHFLNVSLSIDGESRNCFQAYDNLRTVAEEFSVIFPAVTDSVELEKRLTDKASRTVILEHLAEYLGIAKKNKQEYELLKAVCGLKFKIGTIFNTDVIDEETRAETMCFSEPDLEEKEEKLLEVLGEDFYELLFAAKEVYDSAVLSSLLQGEKYLSVARVRSYEEHRKDLQDLKSIYKEYLPELYAGMFRKMNDKSYSYSAYVGSVNSYGEVKRRNKGKNRDYEGLVKKILKDFANLSEEERADLRVKRILDKINANTLLPKQLTFANGTIPNQIHAREMKKILDNAAEYLPFLKKTDEYNLMLKDRILQIFRFQIPYYVGPLGQEYRDKKGYNVWAERIEPGRIYPWNFEEKIDVKGAAEKFIERMVGHCTYISGERSLPKNSLLYERFMVLNELNNLKIRGEKISVEQKQSIYKQLFSKGKKVTKKALVNLLVGEGILEKGEDDVVTGIDKVFNSSLTTIGKFKGIFGERADYDDKRKMIEDIVFWGTVYGNDKKFLKQRINATYGYCLEESQIKRILGFKFSGWGNLSKTFLEMTGYCEDGMERSIINALWETNHNLMELLSNQYSYRSNLEQLVVKNEKVISEWTPDDLEEMYLSPAVKRMVWQTLKIMQELRLVLGEDPARIFVEMPRDAVNGQKGQRTISRKNKLIDLYKSLGKEGKIWVEELTQENRTEAYFRIKKIYLYYLQMGKCMYSGEAIDLKDLMDDNKYDIDHIYPRHYIKDDSIENNLVLVKKQINAHKTDEYPIEGSIRKKQGTYWRNLMNKGFITKEKYTRLVRNTEFSDEEKAAFVSRQLVETRQGTKAITQILQSVFPHTDIVFSKAGLVSDFRHKFDFPKVRCINDFHHANDAYLNIVVGNTYFVKFTSNPLNFIREGNKHYGDERYRYHMEKIFDYTVRNEKEIAWKADKHTGSIGIVRKVMNKNTPLITRRAEEVHGTISKETIYSAKIAKEQVYMPVKTSDPRLADVTKYGGVTSVATSGYVLVEYNVKGKKIRSLEAVPVYLGRIRDIKEESLIEYLRAVLEQENKGKEIENLKILLRSIFIGTQVKINGYDYILGGKTGNYIYLKSFVQLKMDVSNVHYMKNVEKAVASGNFETHSNPEYSVTADKNIALYQYLLNKLGSKIFDASKTTILDVLTNGELTFRDLSIEEQCKVIMQIIGWITSSQQSVDLHLIGGNKSVGKRRLNKIINNEDTFEIIFTSVTGLFITKADVSRI